ncbi:MAG TPA: protein kinase, partial [Hyphomicrobiaceae bacterium]|nr:protein kinase [Hyphomicrobiaceae bacterium]
GYMVLQFEEGQSLKSWLRSLGRAPRQKELDQIVAPLLDALTLIHSTDFLHRDIAPDNIIIRTDGSPVLIDFGSARGEIAHHTRTVSALVKPGYSPYEQYAETGKQQGAWTDIYALAATLYHAITGRRPPDAPSRIVKDEFRPAREAAIGAYRAGFLAAIDRGLILNIEKRPRSVEAWRAELLAPDPQPRRWFAGGADPAVPGKEPLAETVSVAATVPLQHEPVPKTTSPLVPEPALPASAKPESPRRPGRFVDFIDGLRKPAVARRADIQGAAIAADLPPPSLKAAPVPNAGARQPAVTAHAAASSGLGWGPRAAADASVAGTEKLRPNPVLRASPSDKQTAAQRERDAKKEALLLPVPQAALKPPARRKPPKPRAIRSARRSWWRPLVFKLMIGIGIASIAVAYQDQLPRFEMRGSGIVSSSPRDIPEASIAMRRRSGAQETTEDRKANDRLKNDEPKSITSLLVRRFPAHPPGDTLAAYSLDQRLIVTTGRDGTMKIWSAKDGTLVRTLELDNGAATAIAVHRQNALTGHSEGTVVLWDLAAGTKIKTFKRNDARIWSLAFEGSGGDRFFAAAHDWSVALWETATQSAPLHVFNGHDNAVQAVTYSPAKGLVASGGADKLVNLWSTASLSNLQTYRPEKDFVTALQFSPDGRWLAVGMLDGRIRILSTRSRRRGRLISGHDDAISSLRFVDDGDRLISSSRDGTARVWGMSRRRLLRTYGSAGPALGSLDVSSSGREMVTAGDDGMVTVWRVAAPIPRPSSRQQDR